MYASSRQLIVWGRGGHSRALVDVIQASGWSVAAYVIDEAFQSELVCIPPSLSISDLEKFCSNMKSVELGFIIAIGLLGKIRREKAQRLASLGISPVIMQHPSAVVSKSAHIGEGAQILAQSYVGPGVKMGRHSIVNTSAVVEHDVKLGEGVDVAPGATILGGVTVGDDVLIGANATVLPGIYIAASIIVGAGSVVTRNLVVPGKYVGNPARLLGS